MEINAVRPNIKSAWDFVKPGYSQKVQRYWEALEASTALQPIYLRRERPFCALCCELTSQALHLHQF